MKDLQTEHFPLSLPDTPNTGASSQNRSYPVLPPIGKLLTADSKLSFGQSLNTANLGDNSECESYLFRMDKEKELKAKVGWGLIEVQYKIGVKLSFFITL